MKLSVLIPVVPNRFDMCRALMLELHRQIRSGPVELLALCDNKRRSIGKKREALVQIARGDYLAFVDDDDWISPVYVDRILAGIEQGPDVVVFDTLTEWNGGFGVHAQHSLRFENEQYNPAGFKRKPWQMHAWRRELAQAHDFPDANKDEDWGWCAKLCAEAKTEVLVPGALYIYRYSDAVTEALK